MTRFLTPVMLVVLWWVGLAAWVSFGAWSLGGGVLWTSAETVGVFLIAPVLWRVALELIALPFAIHDVIARSVRAGPDRDRTGD